MSTTLALLIAWTFWGSQGVAPSCQPQVEWTREDVSTKYNLGPFAAVAAYAEVDRCTMVITPFGWGGCTSRYIQPYGDCNYRKDSDYVGYCSTIVHEAGHLWGLDHTDDDYSVMSRYGPDWDHIPMGCKQPMKFRWCYHKRYSETGALKSSIPPRVRRKCIRFG
jgi:hypothetical protein